MTKFSVGIDIGTDNLTMVCLSQKKGALHKLIEYASLPRNDEPGIKKLLQSSLVRRGPTRYSIQDGSLRIQKVTVPVVPKEELEEVIKWSLKEALKIPVDSYTIRHYPLGQPQDNKQSYLALAIERTKLQNYLIELQKLGVVQPAQIEPQIQALANCINLNYDLEPNERVGLIHLDTNVTYFGVVSLEGLLFCRTFPRFNHVAADGLQQFFSKIAIEIQYSYESYIMQCPKELLSHALLAGRDIELPGLQEQIAETLQVPIHKLEVFKKIDLTAEQHEKLDNTGVHYAAALGLAI